MRSVYGKIFNSWSEPSFCPRSMAGSHGPFFARALYSEGIEMSRTSHATKGVSHQSRPLICSARNWHHRLTSLLPEHLPSRLAVDRPQTEFRHFCYLVCPGRSSSKPSLVLHSRSPFTVQPSAPSYPFSLLNPRSPLDISISILLPPVRHLFIGFISHPPFTEPF